MFSIHKNLSSFDNIVDPFCYHLPFLQLVCPKTPTVIKLHNITWRLSFIAMSLVSCSCLLCQDIVYSSSLSLSEIQSDSISSSENRTIILESLVFFLPKIGARMLLPFWWHCESLDMFLNVDVLKIPYCSQAKRHPGGWQVNKPRHNVSKRTKDIGKNPGFCFDSTEWIGVRKDIYWVWYAAAQSSNLRGKKGIDIKQRKRAWKRGVGIYGLL